MGLQHKMDRDQMQFYSLSQIVDPNSPVIIIDLFCQCIDFEALGFIVKGKSHEGKPAYEASTLTAIYIYGYLNKIRSCRDLQKACKVNAELWWLTGMQKPGYKTIANFRKGNASAFYNLFKSFREFCIEIELYGKTTVAIDGSKFRAQNSKKNNYNLKKINQHLDYIAQQKEDYIKTLEQNDEHESKLEDFEKRRIKYEELKRELADSDQTQISTTDPDARALPLQMNIVQMAYNLQSSVDDKHNLILDFDITNRNDFSALAPMAIASKEALHLKENQSLTVLADKGYYSSKQIAECHNHQIRTLVSPKSKGSSTKEAQVSKANFKYEAETDTYHCPSGKLLRRQGKIYKRKDGIEFMRYAAHWSDCKSCPLFNTCLSEGSKTGNRARMINRTIYEEHFERNDAEVKSRWNEYRRRQAIVEHPFGTIKRQWGFDYTMLKGLRKVKGEFSIIVLCYNLKRVMSILGINGLKKALLSHINLILILYASLKHTIKNILVRSPYLSSNRMYLI